MKNIGEASVFTCTGCGACKAICPVNAIDYQLTENGFFEASVNLDKCVNCGLCQKVCYKYVSTDLMGKSIFEGTAVSARSSSKEIVHSCTSGGVAYEIARWGIDNHYTVAGTIYDYKTNQAKMSLATTLQEIELFKGSKYLQSKSDEAIKQLIEKAKSEPESKFIAFGTPCQILGIRRAFEVSKLKNELILVDLFCHGVPSYLTWKSYLKERGYSDLKNVQFRSTKLPWHFFGLELENSEGKHELLPSARSSFYQLFFENIGLHNSCSNCMVRKEMSSADIRLGDYWGRKYRKNFDGISACVAATEKGFEILKKLQSIGVLSILDQEKIFNITQSQSVSDYQLICKLKTQNYFVCLKETQSLKSAKRSCRKTFSTKSKNIIKLVISFLPIKLQMEIRKNFK